MPCSYFCPVIKCLATFVDSGLDGTFYCQVLGEAMHITSQYLANEEKAVMATSKAEALEVEPLGLQKDLIAAMDAHNTSKEQVKVMTEQLDAKSYW